MLEKIYKRLDDLGLIIVIISLLALLTHSYFRGLTILWVIIGGLFIKRDGYKKIGLELPIFLYLVTLFLSLVSPLDLKHSYKEIYRHLFGFVAPFMLGQITINEEKKKKYIGILIKIMIGYFFIKSNLMIFKFLPSKFGDRYVPLNINPVEFSYIGGVILLYIWTEFLKEKEKYKKIVDLIFVLAMGYVILQTKTRGSWLGLVGAMMVVYILKNNDTIKNILKAIGTFLVVVVFGYIFRNSTWLSKYYNRLLSVSNTKTDYSNTARLIAWKMGMERFKERPFTGWGYKLKNPYPTGPGGANQVLDHPHNEYVAYLVSGGIIGLLGYLYLMISILIKGLKNKENMYWLIMLGITTYTLIYGVVEALFQVSNSLFLFLVFLGIVVAEKRGIDENN
ncbi:O-antigen ligase family protein [Cetobacterium somerae]|uniref:O-antigen ligase family protein n=1 Tax=Cetobacterium somerae TaxID=188913 RepID=UPI003D769F4E